MRVVAVADQFLLVPGVFRLAMMVVAQAALALEMMAQTALVAAALAAILVTVAQAVMLMVLDRAVTALAVAVQAAMQFTVRQLFLVVAELVFLDKALVACGPVVGVVAAVMV